MTFNRLLTVGGAGAGVGLVMQFSPELGISATHFMYPLILVAAAALGALGGWYTAIHGF